MISSQTSSSPANFLGVKQILLFSSKISMVNIAGGALAALANLTVAKRLGPEGLGIIGLVQLWLLYAGLSRPGFWIGGQRQMLVLLGQDRVADAEHVKNVAITIELGFVAFTSALMACFGWFHYDSRVLAISMTIGSVTFLTTSLFTFADGTQWAYQRFRLITRVGLIQEIASPALMVIGLLVFGLYGVLAGPLLAGAFSFLTYVLVAKAFSYRPAWDWQIVRNIFRDGFPLSIYTFLYWGFRTSDRTMTASWLTLTDLGYFTFAMLFINQGCQLVSDFMNVFQSNLFAGLGKLGTIRPIAPNLKKVSLFIAIAAGFAAGFAQAIFRPFIAFFLPKFLPGVPVFEILSINLVVITSLFLPSTVLISPTIKRQSYCIILQCIALAFNVALAWSLTRRGFGLAGIAWSSALSQLFLVVCFFALLHDSLFEQSSPREWLRFYAWQFGLMALPFALYFVVARTPLLVNADGRTLPHLLMRMALPVVFWAFAAYLVYLRWWTSVDHAA